jgi:NAD+ synthase (glutamine-hydrolysing)
MVTDTTVADINPIGAISKTDLKKFIKYAQGAFDLPVLKEQVLSISRTI